MTLLVQYWLYHSKFNDTKLKIMPSNDQYRLPIWLSVHYYIGVDCPAVTLIFPYHCYHTHTYTHTHTYIPDLTSDMLLCYKW